MAKRSHFLALLGQSGWKQAELGALGGPASATMRREGQAVSIELWEQGQLLASLEGQGSCPREIVGSLQAKAGAYVDLVGAEEAWIKSMEILFAMQANTMSMEPMSGSLAGLASRKIDGFGSEKNGKKDGA